MAKIDNGPLGPDISARFRGSHYVRSTRWGWIAQKWPRPRRLVDGQVTWQAAVKARTPYDYYKQMEFGWAAFWAANPTDYEFEAAQMLIGGSTYVWRDVLIKAAYGSLFDLVGPDGRVWSSSRMTTSNIQYQLDTIGTTLGAMLYRDVDGWHLIIPGTPGQILSLENGIPKWKDQYPDNVTQSTLILATANPALTNARLLAASGTIDINLGTAGLASFDRKALSGDVAAALGSNVTVIQAGAVSYAKMQNVSATKRLLLRKSAGAGAPEEGTISDALDFVGAATKGDILYRDTAAWLNLGAGANGYVLTSNGPGTVPSWQPTYGGGAGLGSAQLPYYANANYYLTPPSVSGASVTTVALTANLIYLVPIYVQANRTFTSIAAKVTTGSGVAGDVARLGIYNIAPADNSPATVLLDAGTIPITAGGFQTITINKAIPPGWYYLAILPKKNISVSAISQSFALGVLGFSITGGVPSNWISFNAAAWSVLQDLTAVGMTLNNGGTPSPLIGIR